MAIVYPTDPNLPPAPESAGSRILDFAQQHLLLAGALIIAIGLGIGFLINKLRGGGSTTPGSDTGTDQGQQTLYVPTSNTFENIYTATDSNNTTTNINPPPPEDTFPKTATVRASTGSKYDKQYKGAALFQTPATPREGGKAAVGFAPFGSHIQLLSQTQGSPYSAGSTITTWYLTPKGYISAHDITGLGAGGIGSGGIMPFGGALAHLRMGTGGGVPLRASPEANSAIVGMPSFGSSVGLTGAQPVNGFYEARHFGQLGYLAADDVIGLG